MFPGLTDTLKTMVDQLERCQKALADFLEQKRSAMPRFYFIGDDDLLEILGQAKNPAVIQVCSRLSCCCCLQRLVLLHCGAHELSLIFVSSVR